MTAPFQDELLNSLRDSAAGYGLFDPQDRLRDANPAFLANFDATLEGAPTWEQLMRDCHRRRRGVLIDTDDIEAWLARVRRSFRQQPLRCFESDLIDGRWMWVTETTRPDGWVLVMMVDVTPLKANEATLRRAHDEALLASMTDPLTQLYNRRYVFSRLADLMHSARHMRFPLCVAMLDLDHFKRINDTLGHGAGDRVLQHFAAQVKRQLRPLDIAGRMGGEEFLFVLPNADAQGALQAVERVRRLVADSVPLPDTAPALRYTVSVGVAQARADDTPDLLIGRADHALYRAKAAGRNCLVAEPVEAA